MKKLTLLLTFVFVLSFAGVAMANSDNITLNWDIPVVNELSIADASLTFDLTALTPTPGGNFPQQTGSTTYSYSTNDAAAKKITAVLNADTPSEITISADPTAPAAGSIAGSPVVLSSSVEDIVTNITVPSSEANIALVFLFDATGAAPSGSDSRTATLTLVDQ